jgi:XTP/dITP diphosphohydrolase
MLDLRFLSANKHKIAEAKQILEPIGLKIVPIHQKIDELQITDTARLVKDKAVKAFRMIGRPLFVEHTGLYLEYLNGVPGGLTQVFWDTLGADRFAELFGNSPNTKVIAKTVVGYIDGRKFFSYEGTISGSIAKEPRGNRDFQWDCVFIPDGHDKTFSELGEKKNEISMRRKAFDQLAAFLRG